MTSKTSILARRKSRTSRHMLHFIPLRRKTSFQLQHEILGTQHSIRDGYRLRHMLRTTSPGDRDGGGGGWFHFHGDIFGHGYLKMEAVEGGVGGVYKFRDEDGVLFVPCVGFGAFEFYGEALMTEALDCGGRCWGWASDGCGSRSRA